MDPVKLIPRWLRARAGEYLRKRGFGLQLPKLMKNEVWIDVGAHLGEGTIEVAMQNPKLLVFAFEPNWTLARQIMGLSANFVVLPMAVSDKDGLANFFISADDFSSSLTTMEAKGVKHWKEMDRTVKATVQVPTIRIDTFMRLADLQIVDFLKIDAEGIDLRVVQSAGNRLRDIRKIKLEVDTAPNRLYSGAPGHEEVVDFFRKHDFDLTKTETQHHGRQEDLTFVQRGISVR